MHPVHPKILEILIQITPQPYFTTYRFINKTC